MNDAYRLPEEFQTDRYLLRRVVPDHAEAIFDSYGTDVIATRYLGWKPELPPENRTVTEATL